MFLMQLCREVMGKWPWVPLSWKNRGTQQLAEGWPGLALVLQTVPTTRISLRGSARSPGCLQLGEEHLVLGMVADV